VPEPTAPWPAYTKSFVACVPASTTPLPKATLPAPFDRCKDPLYSDAATSQRLSPSATLHRRETEADVCCYVTFKQETRHLYEGRPLRDDGGFIEAPATVRADWADAPDPAWTEGDAGGAEAWAAKGAREHASIASFARVSLALLAQGAPPDLIERTSRAALDEVAHARFAFGVASARAGRPIGPGALDVARALPIPATLAELAREAFADGCMSESRAAIAARREAVRTPAGALRDTMLRVADDEERHAELAWRIAAWAVRAGGAEAAHALREALEGARREDDDVLRGLVVPCAEALLGCCLDDRPRSGRSLRSSSGSGTTAATPPLDRSAKRRSRGALAKCAR
jgi:hypothetical protein